MFLTALCKQQYPYNEDYVVFKPEEKHHRLSRNHNFYTKKNIMINHLMELQRATYFFLITF